jgi:hypothetical protein
MTWAQDGQTLEDLPVRGPMMKDMEGKPGEGGRPAKLTGTAG